MTPTSVILPDDLITEVLSFLPIKCLLRFRCVSKSWGTLIFDPAFVKLHLNRSAQNQHFTLVTLHATDIPGDSPDGSDSGLELDYSVVPYSLRHLIENPSFALSFYPYYRLSDKKCFGIVGTCNGLILLNDTSSTDAYVEYWLRLWNPATKTPSQKNWYFRDVCNPQDYPFMFDGYYKFTFGCDNSTGTYKVVASRYNPYLQRSSVRILSSDDNIWRDIETFPVIPLHLDNPDHHFNVGVYLSGTLNWLAIHNEFHYNFKDITVEQFVIISLDLETESYNQYLLPRGFDRVPPAEPTVGVLGGFLCFSYSCKDIETDFVIWRMQKFGVEESWTQFLKISYQNLQIDYDFSDEEYHFQLLPLLLSEDADTLILTSTNESLDSFPILYNWRNNRAEQIKMTASFTISDNRTEDYICWCSAKNYVESLVSIS